MRSTSLISLVLVLTAAPAGGASWHRGENLLTTFVPSPEEWVAFERSEGDLYTTLWRRKGAEESDTFAVTVIEKFKHDLADFREAQDAPGKLRCERFDSEILEDAPVNGFPRLMWRTLCERDDGFTASILHVAIQGRDSFYHVQKMWRVEVTETELSTWEDRLRSASVCDTRRKGPPCPEGFSRVR